MRKSQITARKQLKEKIIGEKDKDSSEMTLYILKTKQTNKKSQVSGLLRDSGLIFNAFAIKL